MGLIDEIEEIVSTCENSIYELLKKIVDDGIQFSMDNQYDDVDTFLYVNNLLLDAYKKFASKFGTSCYEDELWLERHFPNIEVKIDYYVEPLVQRARNKLQKILSEVFLAKDYYELSDKYEKIYKYLSNKHILDYDYLLDGLDIGVEYIPKEKQLIQSKKIKAD